MLLRLHSQLVNFELPFFFFFLLFLEILHWLRFLSSLVCSPQGHPSENPSAALPALAWCRLPVVRAQSPGGCSHQPSHTSGSAYAAVLTGIAFASLFTFLSPYLQAPLWSLPLQTNIQAFSLCLPISAGGCSPQRVISTSQAFLTIWKIFFAS